MALQSLPEVIYVHLSQVKSDRSNQQNRYYWGVVLKLVSEETGYQPEEIHELFKNKYLKQFIEINGDEYEICGSTTRLKTHEMEEYLAKIRQFASMKLSLYIPLPNEVEF